MNVLETGIDGVLILEPKVFGDERGFFLESWNQNAFNTAIGRSAAFVQDNHSRSAKGVLRGLHFQLQQPQAKLVRVTQGAVLDVVVDLRKSSPSFGRSLSVELSEQNKRQLWIPEGLAHGFAVLSQFADFLYKTTDYYHPASERCLLWNDSELGIAWPTPPAGGFVVSAKDQQGEHFDKTKVYFS
jgi:dTDP-4-dehydrorhamnose 3,5-epimerase